jgi:hypothetical protein
LEAVPAYPLGTAPSRLSPRTRSTPTRAGSRGRGPEDPDTVASGGWHPLAPRSQGSPKDHHTPLPTCARCCSSRLPSPTPRVLSCTSMSMEYPDFGQRTSSSIDSRMSRRILNTQRVRHFLRREQARHRLRPHLQHPHHPAPGSRPIVAYAHSVFATFCSFLRHERARLQLEGLKNKWVGGSVECLGHGVHGVGKLCSENVNGPQGRRFERLQCSLHVPAGHPVSPAQ